MDYGTVETTTKTLTLTQKPFLDDRDGITAYWAIADDYSGNQYLICWPIIKEGCEDESESCDWKDFSLRRL